MSENDDNFKEIVRKLQENLRRDKEEVERAVKNFTQIYQNVSYWSNKVGASESKELRSENCDLQRRVTTAPLPQTTSRLEYLSSHRVDNLDTTMAINGRRNYRTPVYSNALVMPAPKYGLPGLGEYEEKRKRYQQEWKQEYNKYLSELAERPKRKQRNADDLGILDYEEMLTRKREEERQYRYHNGDLSYPNVGGMRPARSEGHLDRNGQMNYNGHENGNRFHHHHETREITGVRYNDHVDSREDNYNHYDHNYSYETNGAYRRPHSYPTDTNGFIPSDEVQRIGHNREEDESFSPHDYRRHDVDEQRIERRRRESFGREVENFYRDSSNTNNGGHRQSGAVFELHSHRPSVEDRNHLISNPGNDYHAELSRQVADVKQRKRREKEEQIRYDMRIEEENRNYDPWGRGGAGAPVRDRAGNTITVRGQLGQGGNVKRVSVVAPVVDTSNSRRGSHNRELREETLPIEPTPIYAMQHNTRIHSEQNQEPKTSYESYQEDLRKQIEDKKRREMEEKERNRLEEEKLLRRIQEENEKMQREYEQELKKQQERDAERRRRNEELLHHQQELRKEEERKRREEREKDRRQSYEDREKAFGRGPTVSTSVAKSPPIRSKRNPSISRPIEKPKQKSSKATSDASKEHVLSQLSAMRQQLEREQKTMQEQLREQMKKDDYEVFDKQQQPQLTAHSAQQSEPLTKGKPPPIVYRPISGPNGTNQQSEVVSVESPTTPNLEQRFLPFVGGPQTARHTTNSFKSKAQKLWPAMALAFRASTDHKTLKGESFFLGVESNDVENDDGNYSGWNESKARKTWNVYDDLEPQPMPDRELMKQQHEYDQQQDPDEVRDDSFLDEFLAKNLQRR